MLCTVCNTDNPGAAIACRSCGSPLAGEGTAASEQALPAGTVLQGGAFVVERVLGQGGFGITYKGRDTTLNRTVAIKEFFPQAQGCVRKGTAVHPSGGITSVEFREERTKFLGEGQRLAQFQHTGIVRVFSLFEQNNTAYMVMEFLKGKTFLEIVEETGPLDERSVIQVVEQVASALDVVHKRNVIRRDIKPENVIVTADKRVVLIDFGTAREFAVGKTRRMTTALTPGYAPLEQYGQHARFGAFTDIYALGATTYFLLTGQVPVQPPDRAAGVELASPRRLRGRISSHMSDAIMWAMEMRVDKRPQSASEFAQAVRGTRSPPSGRSTTRSTLTSVRTFIALSLCIIGVIVPVSLFLSERQEAREAMTPRSPEVSNSRKPIYYLKEGRDAYAKRNYDWAIVEYTKFIDLKPQTQVGYHERACARLNKEDYDGAISDFDDAIARDPESAWARCGLRLIPSVNDASVIPTAGKSLIILAVVDQALHFRIFDGDGDVIEDTDEKRLTDQARQIEDFRTQLGSLWPPHELTESEKARVVAAVTSIVACSHWAYHNRGLAWEGKTEYDRAIDDFTEAIQLNPRFEMAYYNRGRARYYKAQNYEGDELRSLYRDAIGDFSMAIDINDQFADAYRFRAILERVLGHFAAADADEDTAKRLNDR